MGLRILDTGPATAQSNMSIDADLLKGLTGPDAILHHYDWAGNALTFGHFIDPDLYLKAEGLKAWGYEAARRPTGGGIIFHTCDLAFSLLIPVGHRFFSHNTMASYALVNEAVRKAIEEFLDGRGQALSLLEGVPSADCPLAERFCMAHPTRYDVMVGGRKVGGAAQRRTREGVLHQGSICLTTLPADCLAALLIDDAIADGMRHWSCPLLGESAPASEIAQSRLTLRRLLQDSLT